METVNDSELYDRAAELYPDSSHNQSAWVRSVTYLRAHSNVGWAIDKIVDKGKETSVLRGYVAPTKLHIPPMVTHKTLPDDQIIPPPNNVMNLRESKS